MKTGNVEYTAFSGWVDPPSDVLPSLTGDLTCEVAVVGGGIGGMSTALRLAERGQDVVLLEAEFCGHGASSRNAGQLAGAPGGDLQLLDLLYRKKMPGMIRLAEHAAYHVEDLIKKHDIDCDYEQTGNVFAAVSRGQLGRVRRVAKLLRRVGADVELGTSEELGIPRGFLGGMREKIGGIMNPGRFTLGLRRALLRTPARVFEQTKVTDVAHDRGQVVLSTPWGEVRADKVVLATNAYAGEWDITPPRLSVPIWVIEVETEPIDPARLAALGWTSRSGLVTQHNIMENYRLTPRGTIVFGVRRLERGRTYPLPQKAPDPALVEELAGAFATRFPALSDVAVDRAWGGWIAITSSWLPIAGQLDDSTYYSIACNGHGLAQAPYVGSLIADLIVDGERHEDLEELWREEPEFPRPMMMSPLGLRTVWLVDRFNDFVNGSRRNARRGVAP
ncbi:NAD(P)/FAD-dependent oxidoreductase [Amycolatopsis regifaucium]|uniref:Oxidoreductase n=1 Tax=Amycolatopsis regifaucium TaxID=546365 RepID=A0A154M3U7_9PSEU|nr:FAD-dependent oxidoreductase [Amycolatopsis regifaucium]KZB79268.1 oxidoreductase [Amycolatopsis regifaucium]OKA07450.1 oxidoreductase [Amycolatopsis regifaucium]SFH11168.1 Glycine/D-amino acid oxidase [Amycolatopsis regifaucium]